MSMIASTLAQLGELVTAETKTSYREQVEVEMTRLDGLIKELRVSLDLEGLRRAAGTFAENVDDASRSRDLQTECALLLEALSKKGSE